MMYKTPTFAEPQQCNRPFPMGQLSAFIIQLVTWQVLTRSEWKVQGRTQVKYLIGRSFSLHLASWKFIFIIFHQNGEDAKRNMWCCINFPAYKTISPVDILQGKIPRLYRKFTNFWILKIATDLHSNYTFINFFYWNAIYIIF